MANKTGRDKEPDALNRFLFGEILEESNEIVKDHCLNPRNLGVIVDADAQARITGPCGDTMEIHLKISGNVIRGATFMTDGCGYTIACGSMATEMLIGSRVKDAIKIDQHKILELNARLRRSSNSTFEGLPLIAPKPQEVSPEEFKLIKCYDLLCVYEMI